MRFRFNRFIYSYSYPILRYPNPTFFTNRVFTNFFKESFLIDFTQKVFTSRLVLTFFIQGPLLLLLSSINTIQTSFLRYLLTHPLNLVKLHLNDSPITLLLSTLICAVVFMVYLWVLWLVL